MKVRVSLIAAVGTKYRSILRAEARDAETRESVSEKEREERGRDEGEKERF